MAGIYIHIPFCKQACSYCNFHFSTNKKQVQEYIDAVLKEIALRKDYINETVDTIYFGGGTPSFIEAKCIDDIIKAIKYNYPVNDEAEITLEANPDDINEEKLIAWKSCGINRLSLGIQSFVEEELTWMNRSHTATQSQNCINLIKKHFKNYSIDLIFGSQLLSNDGWLQNIQTALAFNPPHISCYALTIEEKTLLGNQVSKRIIKDIDNEKQAVQFELLMSELEKAGYLHYEISNYAIPGYESKHNSSYWKGKHYLGLGASAHSYNKISRSWNVANNALYIQSIINGVLPEEVEALTVTQQINEHIMIALRTGNGIDVNLFEDSFGKERALDLQTKMIAWIKNAFVDYNQGCYKLTRKGKLYADGIAADLFF